MIFFLTAGQDVWNWVTTAAIVSGMLFPVLVFVWVARDWFDKRYVTLEKFRELKAALDEATNQFKRALDHRSAADLARWDKLEGRYERLFEKFNRREREQTRREQPRH